MADEAALERWERQAQWPMGAVALVFLAVYSVRVLGHPQGWATHLIDVLTYGTWAIFVVDYLVRLWLAPNRRDWFVRHLLDLAIVALPMLQPLRVMRLIVLIGALQKVIGTAIHGRALAYAIASGVIVVYAASLAELQAERYAPHATITSLGRALWWSMTTITTVGYGNEFPITATGRIIAVLLMIAGITVLGIITAALASLMVRRVVTEDAGPKAPTADEIAALRDEIRALREQLSGGPR